jgi:TonB family protein
LAAGGKPDAGLRARSILADLFPGGRHAVSGLFSEESGGEMRRALSELRRGPIGDSSGTPRIYGTGKFGDGPGNSTVGINGAGTRYGHDRAGADRAGHGILDGNKKSSQIPEIVQDGIEYTGIDPELIRRVIHSHRDQVRYCYELELTSHPELNGKVKVRFVIVEGGVVSETSVAESTVRSHQLESCLMDRVRSWNFPLPKRAGMAVVSYPFLFKQSGD